MERCPVCRARVRENECGRCGTDLTKPLALEAQTKALARRAVWLWQAGHGTTALHLLGQALRLHRDPVLVRMRDFFAARQLVKVWHYLEQGEKEDAACLCKAVAESTGLPTALALQGFIADLRES